MCDITKLALNVQTDALRESIREWLPESQYILADESCAGSDLLIFELNQGTLPRWQISAASDQELSIVCVDTDRSPKRVQIGEWANVFGYVEWPTTKNQFIYAVEIACVRGKELHNARKEKLKFQQALEDRKYVERAKAVVMERRRIDEPSAYRHLQLLARQRRQTIGEVAKNILFVTSALSADRS